MANENVTKYQKKIVTIPNILSFFRICLIPVIIWLYCKKQDNVMTTLVLVLSGLTDVVDGIIARHFGMISDLGKVLDPVADKLTQLATLICLLTRFPFMLLPIIVLVVKEISAAIMGGMAIKKTRVVNGAVWHGKVTTVLLYLMMFLHLIWIGIPAVVSNTLIIICTAMMFISAFFYGKRNIDAMRASSK